MTGKHDPQDMDLLPLRTPKGRTPIHPSGSQERLTIRLAPAYVEFYRELGNGAPSSAIQRLLVEYAEMEMAKK